MKISVDSNGKPDGKGGVELDLSIILEGLRVTLCPPLHPCPPPTMEELDVSILDGSSPGTVTIRVTAPNSSLMWIRYYITDNAPVPMPLQTATPYQDSQGSMCGPYSPSPAAATWEQSAPLGPNQCILALAWALFPNDAQLVQASGRRCNHSSSSSSSSSSPSLASSSSKSSNSSAVSSSSGVSSSSAVSSSSGTSGSSLSSISSGISSASGTSSSSRSSGV